MPDPAYPTQSPVACAVRSACPRCGRGHLFKGFLQVAPSCDACGLDYAFADPADGPAFFVMMTTAIPAVAFGLWLELTYNPPVWLHFVLTLPVVLIACTLPLRFFKAGSWRVSTSTGRRRAGLARPAPRRLARRCPAGLAATGIAAKMQKARPVRTGRAFSLVRSWVGRCRPGSVRGGHAGRRVDHHLGERVDIGLQHHETRRRGRPARSSARTRSAGTCSPGSKDRSRSRPRRSTWASIILPSTPPENWRGHEDARQAELLGGDPLQAAEQHVGGGVDPVSATRANRAGLLAKKWVEDAGAGDARPRWHRRPRSG